MSYYLHQVPGRVRIKSPQVKGNPAAVEMLPRLLEGCAGIRDFSANPLTGSVIVTFDPRVSKGESILGRLVEGGLFDPARALDCDSYVQQAAARAGEKVGRAILQATLERTLQGTPFGLVTALL